MARGLVEDPAYVSALRRRLLAGKAGQMEVLLFRYAYGGPPDRLAGPVDVSGPASTSPGESGPAPGLELSKEAREKLLSLVEGLRARLNDDPSLPSAPDPES